MLGFGELEAEIMDAIWGAEGPLSVREVHTVLNARRPLAYTTIQTVTEILRQKGWLTRTKDGRAYRYQASSSREEYAAGLIDEVFASGADRTATLVRLVETMDPGEVAQLRAALDQAKRG